MTISVLSSSSTCSYRVVAFMFSVNNTEAKINKIFFIIQII